MPNLSVESSLLRFPLILFFAALAACTEGAETGATTGATAAPTALPVATSSAAKPATVLDAAPPPPPASAIASAAPTAASSAAAATDAGAPRDAGAKVRADAGAVTSLDGGSDAGSATAAGDAGAAQPQNPATQIANQVDAIFAGKKTFSASFKQEHTQRASGAAKTATGTFVFERPNRFSFRYDPPNKNRIVSDGVTLKAYVADDESMFESPIGKSQYGDAFAFLSEGGISKAFSFTIHGTGTPEGSVVLLGKPKAVSPSYDHIFFYIDKALLAASDPGVIHRLVIVDAQSNKNRFDLSKASQPASIDPQELVFTPPPGTNITR